MQVVDAEPHHITQFVHSDVRQVDKDEWALGTGMSYSDTLTLRLDLEVQYVRALLDDGGLCIALWGVMPDERGNGMVWLIANTSAERIGRRIHRFWPEEVGRMHMRHSYLYALAYAKNDLHLRWLGQIGFAAEEPVYVGPGMVPFIPHSRTQECAHRSH